MPNSVDSYSITYRLAMRFTYLYISILVLLISECCGQDGDEKVRAPLKERSRREAQEKDFVYKHASACHIS